MRYWFVWGTAAWVVPEAEICVLLSLANPLPELDAQLKTCHDLCPKLISPIVVCAYALLICAAYLLRDGVLSRCQGRTTRRDARQKVVKETKSRRPVELAAGLARPARRHGPGEARQVADGLPGLPGKRGRACRALRRGASAASAVPSERSERRREQSASETSAGSVGAKRAKRA